MRLQTGYIHSLPLSIVSGPFGKHLRRASSATLWSKEEKGKTFAKCGVATFDPRGIPSLTVIMSAPFRVSYPSRFDSFMRIYGDF